MGVRLSGVRARVCQNILRTFGIWGGREKGGNKGGGGGEVGNEDKGKRKDGNIGTGKGAERSERMGLRSDEGAPHVTVEWGKGNGNVRKWEVYMKVETGRDRGK
jgi:hypothetical protein